MPARVFLLDNFDSFTWNLVQALRVLGARVRVRRNDAVSVARVAAMRPTHVVLSPGPGRPENAGVMPELIDALLRQQLGPLPVLGVCLGHQGLAAALGGSVVGARRLVHGKPSPVWHDGHTIFDGLANPTPMGRYHSLAVAREGLPEVLAVSAWTEDGEIMGLRHQELPIEGVQFHPESILSPEGTRLLGHFLTGTGRPTL